MVLASRHGPIKDTQPVPFASDTGEKEKEPDVTEDTLEAVNTTPDAAPLRKKKRNVRLISCDIANSGGRNNLI